MENITRNKLVFATIFAAFLASGCNNRLNELPADIVRAQTANEWDEPFPVKKGARLEVEIKGVKVAFRWLPPGKFTRQWNKWTDDGWEEQTTWDGDREDFEIELTKGFWLAETETTQELWQAVMKDNPSEGVRTGKTPVNNVSWEETQDFISKLNDGGYAPDGFEFCLPTEAQWEYACMAGSTSERYGELEEIAWYIGNSDRRAHEVGKKKANAWGLYDMLGNVWELCSDWYCEYPMENLTDYTGPQDGLYRVIRGGGWYGTASRCRHSARDCTLFDRFVIIGFRLSLVPKEQQLF